MSALTVSARRVAVIALLAAAVVVLHRVGTGPLAMPSPSDLAGDAALRPTDLAMATLRLGAFVVAVAAVALSGAELVATTVPAVGRVLQRVVPAGARRIVRVGLGLRTSAAPVVLFASVGPSLLIPSVVPVAVASAAAEDATPTVARIRPSAVPEPTSAGPADDRPGTASMRPSRAAVPSPTVPSPTDPSPTVGVAAATLGPDTTWSVAPGESFWTIAAEVTAAGLGRRATTAEITPVWRALVEVNRARLVDPDDPDLLLVGQTLDLGGLPR